jgi:Niemann-Pick C1 protein
MRSGGDGDLGGMAKIFYKIGAFAANRPLTVNATCLVFTVLCALGMLKVVIETSPQEIWVPPASTTKLEKNYFDDNFNPFFRIEQVGYVLWVVIL